MNVSCDINENISEATITIIFPYKQTIMKHVMDRFNLPQFECRIQNLINLPLNRKNLNMFFLLLSFFISQINHATTSVWFFLKMCTFSYGHLFLVSIFYQLTSERNQVHTGDLTHCKQTLQLIKFYLIKSMKGNRGNWLAQFKFTFFLKVFCARFFNNRVKLTVSLFSLSSVHLFSLVTILTIGINSCKEHIKCLQLLTL